MLYDRTLFLVDVQGTPEERKNNDGYDDDVIASGRPS